MKNKILFLLLIIPFVLSAQDNGEWELIRSTQSTVYGFGESIKSSKKAFNWITPKESLKKYNIEYIKPEKFPNFRVFQKRNSKEIRIELGDILVFDKYEIISYETSYTLLNGKQLISNTFYKCVNKGGYELFISFIHGDMISFDMQGNMIHIGFLPLNVYFK